jgi:hypothetical protein
MYYSDVQLICQHKNTASVENLYIHDQTGEIHLLVGKPFFSVGFSFLFQEINLEYSSPRVSFLGKLKILATRIIDEIHSSGISSLTKWFRFTSFDVPENLEIDFPVILHSPEGLWISRQAIIQGVYRERIDSSIEYDFVREVDYKIRVWQVRNQKISRYHKNFTLLKDSISLQTLPKGSSDHGTFSFIELQNCYVNSGISVYNSEAHYIIDQYDNYSECQWPNLRPIKLNDTLSVFWYRSEDTSENAIFIGSSFSWFHFLIEYFPRYIFAANLGYCDRTLLLPKGLPTQIIELIQNVGFKSIRYVPAGHELKVANLILFFTKFSNLENSHFGGNQNLVELQAYFHKVAMQLQLETEDVTCLPRRLLVKRPKNTLRQIQDFNVIETLLVPST